MAKRANRFVNFLDGRADRLPSSLPIVLGLAGERIILVITWAGFGEYFSPSSAAVAHGHSAMVESCPANGNVAAVSAPNSIRASVRKQERQA